MRSMWRYWRFQRRRRRTFWVQMEGTYAEKDVHVVWAVLHGPTHPEIGTWIKVAEGRDESF